VRIISAIILASVSLTGTAHAGPGEDFSSWAADLQQEARERASDSARRAAAPADPLDIEDPFYFELEQFSVDALRLSRSLAENDGPQDLQCIFRGISADAAARVEALHEAESAGDQAHIYAALADLMRDAAEIAPAIDDTSIEVEIERPHRCSNG